MGLMETLFGSSGTGAARAKEAQKLSKEERKWIMEQLASRQGQIGLMFKGMQGAKAHLMGGQGAAAHAARTAQTKAMEKVAAYTGGNPLAMSSAMAGMAGTSALSQIYGGTGAQLADVTMKSEGTRASMLGQASSDAMQGRANVLGSELGVLSSIQDATSGIAGPLLGAAGMAMGGGANPLGFLSSLFGGGGGGGGGVSSLFGAQAPGMSFMSADPKWAGYQWWGQ